MQEVTYSIREHCIPAYDEMSRMRSVQPFPAELEAMEERTAGGTIAKLKAVIESDYFRSLPETAVIQSGGTPQYQWSKNLALAEARRIISETIG